MDDLEDDGLNEAEQEGEPTDDEQTVDFDSARCALDHYAEALEYYSDWFRLIEEEVSMVLDQEQHEFDQGHSKNQNDAQVKDQTLLSTARRKWSQIASAPIYINTFARGGPNPLAAERTKWALEREVYSPRKMLRRMRKRAIIGATVGRLWYLHWGWNPRLREIIYDVLPPSDVLPAPGFKDIHDPECPRVQIRVQMPLEAVRERARFYGLMSEEDVIEIKPDTNQEEVTKAQEPLPGMIRLDRTNPEGGPATPAPGMVTLLISMYRFDPELLEVEETLGAPEPLEQDAQFMRCWTCGYETQVHERDPETGDMPVTGQPCPQCEANAMESGSEEPANPLEGVFETEDYRRYSKYPDGRWIETIIETGKNIYDGPWPYEKPTGGTLPSYPLGQYRIYDDMRYAIPHSDVSWQFNQQLMATMLLQWAVDQVRTSGRVLIFPRNGLVDSRGRNYVPNNRIDSIAWAKNAMVSKAIQEFQPRGVPSGWAEIYGALTNTFRANLGTGELGIGPDQSKNLPVGTAHAIIESGDIPVDDAIANIRDEDSHVLTNIAVMLQCCWTAADWVRYFSDDGEVGYEFFSGADLCDVDVMVTGDPAFDVLQSAKLDRMKTWFGMTPPEQRLAARLLNLEPTMVAQFQKDQAAFLASLPPPEMGGGPPAGRTGSGGADDRPAPPPRKTAPPARTALATASADQLSPELQAGLTAMIQ